MTRAGRQSILVWGLALGLPLSGVAAAGCRQDPEQARIRATSLGKYDAETGKLTEITYDRNKDGKIDTWVQMAEGHPVSATIDTDENGVIDRWEYYDAQGKLIKVGESRGAADRATPPPGTTPASGVPGLPLPATPDKQTGKPDTWAYFGPDGKLTETEFLEVSNTTDKEPVVRREFYANNIEVRAEEDTDGDGVMDRWERFENGRLVSVDFDDGHDGKPDRRFVYDAAGGLAEIDSAPDAEGHYTKRVVPGRPPGK